MDAGLRDGRAMYLREQDRLMNAERYPKLHFPHLYVLDGGYQGFFGKHQVYVQHFEALTMCIRIDVFHSGMSR